MSATETFPLGGGSAIERTVDNGDGTGTRTTYHPDGSVDTVEQLTGLPIPTPPEPSLEELVEQILDALGGE